MKSISLLISSLLNRLTGNEHATMAVLAVVVGTIGGFGAIAFRRLIDLVQTFAYGAKGNLLELALASPWYVKLIVPSVGGLLVGPLVYFLAREAKGHGVPEVMEAIALKQGIIRKRVVFIKCIVSALCIGTGGSVGREGPIVQIGSAIGSSLGQVLKVSADRTRTLVGCGAAAGIAATFNAPIAGSMFALEIILGDFALTTFSPIVISAVAATAISRHFLGNNPAFFVPAYNLISPWELPMYVVLGIFCGAVALSFTTILYRVEDLFESIKFPEYLKAVFGGFIIGLISLVFPHILGVGYPGIDLALMQQLSMWTLLILVILKILATSITIGSGGSGGIFAPSLFMGAMAGGFFGNLVHQIFPNITAPAGAYSIVGMGAVVAGTTHGPISAILILFELTGDYKIILPLMSACIISSLFAKQLLPDSIYTLKLARRGVNLQSGKEVNILKSIPVRDIMNRHPETIYEGLTLSELTQKIINSKHNSFPVVDAEHKLTGILSYIDYHDVFFDENLKDLIVAKDLASPNVVTVALSDDLYTALQKISSKDFSILPVVEDTNPSQLVGLITRRDIISTYNKAVIKQSIKPK